MSTVATIVSGLVAILHGYFMILEMFLWKTPYGLRVFQMTPEKAETTAVLAANQGLYNGFLAIGIVACLVKWGVAESQGRAPLLFLLGCVVVAGIYGAATASMSILFVQSVPAALAIGLVLAIPISNGNPA